LFARFHDFSVVIISRIWFYGISPWFLFDGDFCLLICNGLLGKQRRSLHFDRPLSIIDTDDPFPSYDPRYAEKSPGPGSFSVLCAVACSWFFVWTLY
jgi:hypothetical protein